MVTGTFQGQAAFVPAHETTFTHKIQAPYSDYITEHTFCTQDLGWLGFLFNKIIEEDTWINLWFQIAVYFYT